MTEPEIGPPRGHIRLRACGCSWVQVYGTLVKFQTRCEQHQEMCRNLEDWEIELCQESE